MAALVAASEAPSDPDDADSLPEAEEEVLVIAPLPEERGPLAIEMDAETLAGIPGVNDDPLSALVTLPGVAVNNDFEGGTAIRGTRPVDNAYRVDFMRVGYLFHFGTGSVVDGDLVDGFTFFPAAYGARYQGVIGGVVDVRTRDPIKDGRQAIVDVNLIHGGVLAEGALTDQHRAYFSTRASYYDLVLEPFLTEINDSEADDVDVVQLPRFRDYRGRYQIETDASSRWDFLVDGATDAVELLFHEESTETLQDPALAGAHRFALDYHRQAVVYSRDRSDSAWGWQAGWARNASGFSARLGGAGNADTLVTDNTLRVEARSPEGNSHQLAWGGAISHLVIDYDVLLRDAGCTEFEVDCRFSDADAVGAADKLPLHRLQMFVEDTIPLSERGDGLDLTLGISYARDDYLKEQHWEPRVGMTWKPGAASSLTLAAGRYHQLPAFEYIEDELGNPDLSHLEADHYVLSYRRGFPNGWMFRTEIYRKDSRNLVTADAAARYDNRGIGTAHGAELLVQGLFGARLLGWLALSYSKSVREDLDTGNRFDFAFDQPLIASVVAKFLATENVSLSAKAWFHSGPPHTPILGGDPDPDNPGAFLPRYGAVNGERLPSYFRFDLRLDWTPGDARRLLRDAKLYLEVINATNHRNVSGYEYAEDYASRQSITQIPFFVSVGIRKQW